MRTISPSGNQLLDARGVLRAGAVFVLSEAYLRMMASQQSSPQSFISWVVVCFIEQWISITCEAWMLRKNSSNISSSSFDKDLDDSHSSSSVQSVSTKEGASRKAPSIPTSIDSNNTVQYGLVMSNVGYLLSALVAVSGRPFPYLLYIAEGLVFIATVQSISILADTSALLSGLFGIARVCLRLLTGAVLMLVTQVL